VFYKNLEPNQQIEFEHRVAELIKSTKFRGKQGIKVNDEMRILIAATGVMISFGFEKFEYLNLEEIYIYPEDYYSEINKVYHLGEFNPRRKLLVLSWKHFKEGFDISNDNFNVGIHEFAHVLFFNKLVKSDFESKSFIKKYREKQDLLINSDKLIRILDLKYLRGYAYSNEYEFFAVMLEAFFETPHSFKANFPKLYDIVLDMLNFHKYEKKLEYAVNDSSFVSII
jgi:Mlc titration factor MtfA (ptsG expression regulator)